MSASIAPEEIFSDLPELVTSYQVQLIVYHLRISKLVNLLHYLGLGAYHSGLAINGKELSFGQVAEGTGVYIYDQFYIGEKHNLPVYKIISLGTTRKNKEEIVTIINQLRNRYLGVYYNFIDLNCHHFTQELAGRLLGKAHIPETLVICCGDSSITAAVKEEEPAIVLEEFPLFVNRLARTINRNQQIKTLVLNLY